MRWTLSPQDYFFIFGTVDSGPGRPGPTQPMRMVMKETREQQKIRIWEKDWPWDVQERVHEELEAEKLASQLEMIELWGKTK